MTRTSSSTKNIPTKHQSKIPRKAPRTTRSSSAQGGSVFDRLHKSSTLSSRVRKQTAPVVTKCILTREENEEKFVSKRASRPRRNLRPKRPNATHKTTTDGAIFNRLYSQGTKSSSSKRKASSTETETFVPSIRAVLKPKNHK
jgi:hypothetical protein